MEGGASIFADEDMVRIEGGRFSMGCTNFYPEEAPVRQVDVAPFLLDRHLVTNRQFAKFVRTTGYVTVAERAPDPALYPGILPDRMVPGSIVFIAPANDGKPFGPDAWWHFVAGANWRFPYGPDGIQAPEDHPVVQVTFEDAMAYCRWIEKRLPTDEETEFAARGGLHNKDYAWGDYLAPDGQELANIWLRGFPFERKGKSGPPYTTAVGSYAANPYGVYDLIGNVWEWTSTNAEAQPGEKSCCGVDPKTLDPSHRKILKGGSHLCAPNYCRRYRPAAIWPQPIDTSTTHVGFRCAQSIGGGR